MFYLHRRTTISWDQLRAQFGSQYAETRSGRFKFKKDFERHLVAVLLVYRDANVEASPTGVTLRPSRTHRTEDTAPRATTDRRQAGPHLQLTTLPSRRGGAHVDLPHKVLDWR